MRVPSHPIGLLNPMAASAALPLAGRIAVVTGASRGIGRAIAAHLASLGAALVLGYSTSSAAADLLAAEINSQSTSASLRPRAVAVRADVSDPSAVRSLFDAAEAAFGSPPHILVAAAGVLDSRRPVVADTATEVWDAAMAVNARGAFLCCREAARRLVRGGGGRIVCVSSSLAAAPGAGYGAYTASKAAVEAMVRVLARELRGTGITANCVAPGPVATDMFFSVSDGGGEEAAQENAMGRLGEPRDIAPLVGFLCTDAGEWVNGQVVGANGGIL
ncbi:Short-chain type dehydrogenase [Musa troglodytarum]|uniref:Short-chain type dehydrogenase n=3 Tax=Musa troglodytarum TaxID=320322 RepID=A0A9E7KE35_9LILI|nr:Short-chain type dehydrogenase [Musa troglodytarum]